MWRITDIRLRQSCKANTVDLCSKQVCRNDQDVWVTQLEKCYRRQNLFAYPKKLENFEVIIYSM